VVINKLN